ncbi:hypothetical protein H1V43_32400 [Streptomyces sp. PSKA54]|uniref:Uncharacterized protein n=1 Tax=Streptomyces himalayensis subsp. aureolus TaxID=2758039 RepID=A0A7W2HJB1_9ACTN|nr:hypothetical protein [Streptomyces himalayensis]MBA4865965.1 hypothetical protein [Streptomyces himalayensis subsp. aureolus]
MPELTDAQLDQLIKDIGLKRPRGGSQRKPIAHGTYNGYRQHVYRKEQACAECMEANRLYLRERYAKRRQGGGSQ